jgi:hypothetical protein
LPGALAPEWRCMKFVRTITRIAIYSLKYYWYYYCCRNVRSRTRPF